RVSWEAYNEGKDLIESIERYKERFGYYPKSAHGDKIYRNRENLSFCKSHGIRLSGPPLGRPPKESGERKQLQRQSRKDEISRIPVEGKFGNGKRRYNLDCIKEKRKDTSETTIGVIVLVMNLEKIMGDLLFVFFVLPKLAGKIAEHGSFTKANCWKSMEMAA
ncbi:MAG: transposase, partial [Spirochaetales bacterium]|nr:transposase [Spirochaetales bacterium]